MFYFQILNLYYWYDVERTYNEVLQTFSDNDTIHIFTRDYKMPLVKAENGEEEPNIELVYFNNSARGHAWVLLGITKLLNHAET